MVREQTVDADLQFILTAIEQERASNTAEWGRLELIGWIHDHHDLLSDPTIDYDLRGQFEFQKHNKFFAMLITGKRTAKPSRDDRKDAWFDACNWNKWYTITPKAAAHVQLTPIVTIL